MPKLSREDWEDLRDVYGVTFRGMPSNLFTALLDKVYGPKREGNPGSNPANTGEVSEKVTEIDAMMIYLARTEPGIQPEPPQL